MSLENPKNPPLRPQQDPRNRTSKKNKKWTMEEQEELLQEILKFIKQDVHCVYMRDITSHFARSTAWISDHFPVGSEGYSAISEALERNKSTLKEGLRHRLFDSASPQGQIALYKLLGTAEEKEALSTVINKNTEKQQVTLKID